MLSATIHAILQSAPMRRRNLTEIQISGNNKNLLLVRESRAAHIYLATNETKNRATFEALVLGKKYSILEAWIDDVRPRFMKIVGASADNPYLFPAQGTGHRQLTLMNQKFRAHNERLGITMNLHLARHLAAKVALEDGMDISEVSRLLGHKSIKTTERFYTECVEIFAQRRYQDALIRSKSEHLERAA